jgi:oligoendopeptidase F
MSFETYLNDYEAPFLFVNSEGTNEDILTFAHEFGHYSDAYVNLNAYETVDLAETYSQAMEYLVLSRLDEQLDEEEVDNLARIKMIDTVEMFVEQASYAEFEHRVYALGAENLSAEVLNETARQVAKEYGYYVYRYDEFFSLSWIDIPHYFEQAFYIVSYPISDDLAMQIFDLERGEAGAGMRRYLDNLERDFSGILGLVDAGGFESPFAPGRVAAIAATAREILGL